MTGAARLLWGGLALSVLCHPLETPAAPMSWSASIFPLRPSKLKPINGVEKRQRDLSRAIFIIGDDPASRGWLSRHRGRLRSLDAVGMVVSVNDAASFKALRSLAPELVMAPIRDAQLAEQFDVRGYPTLLIGE